MELLHERCAALDIGKKDLKACVRTPSPKGKRSRRQEIRTFATTTNALLEMRDWLVGERVSLVVMEATGDYWRGAFYLLEDDLEVILVNAAHAKGLPGRKTDVCDSSWLCQMGECGLLRASFVPPEPIRHLRDLTRYRTTLATERTREAQRLEKELEDAGIKLSSDALTKVRRRITWDLRERRGRKIDPEWANRRRLLRGRERLSEKSFAKMWNQIQAEDPSAQILTAWIAKEELRTLLATVRLGGDPHLTRHRLHRFLTWCIDSQIPELLTLAATVDDWWPEINAFVTTGITNARTEGYNRLVKQVKRVSCGFRNREHSARRIRFHCTRKQRAATQTSC